MSRWDKFSSSEQIIIELGLQEWAEYVAGLLEKYPNCPDCESWRVTVKRTTELQNELLALWAEKRRSA